MFILKINIILSLLITYIINRFCWDILTTWYFIDFLYGNIYKLTDNINLNYFYKNNKYKFVYIINKFYILVKIFYKYIITCLFILLIYIIYNYIQINLYIIIYYIIIVNLVFLNINYKSLINIYNIIIFIKNYIIKIFIKFKDLTLKLIILILNYIVLFKNLLTLKLIIYSKYITQLINNFKNEFKISLDLKIYLYNKKFIYKKTLYKLNLALMYILDNLNFNILMCKTIYKKRNIIKLHKKIKKFKPLKSNFEIIIGEFKSKYITKLINLLNSFKLFNYNILNFYFKNKFKLNTLNLNNINVTKFNININTTLLNKTIVYIYIPINIINLTLSDIALSITQTLIIYKKKYILNIMYMYIYIILNFIIKLIKKSIKLLNYIINVLYYKVYKLIKYIVFLIIRKIIYLILITCYFYNNDLAGIIVYDIYNIYIFNFINNYNYSIYLNFLVNYNNLYFLIIILGLQIVLYWAKKTHKFFGNYLWSMIVFPLFLESHKILYFKLFCINLLNKDNFNYILLLRYNILELFNYKVYNIYIFFSNIFLLILLLYFIKKNAFKHIYARFKNSRWFFIKYPVYIYILEFNRLQIIKYISLFIIYINYKFNFNFWFFKKLIILNKNPLSLIIIDFIQEFIIEINNFKYFFFYIATIPNIYILNFIIDILIIVISCTWLITYLNKYLMVDLKFVAFPIVVLEVLFKRVIIYIILYYSIQYIYIWVLDGTILWYSFLAITFLYIYLEIRVHKIPRKTMPWYFRQIVETWPSTYLNQWYTAEYLYFDQQRYIVLRFRLKTFKIEYKRIYKSCEVWNKIIILNYQKEKNKAIRLVSAYCRLMARKENMLREINNFEYQGWYEDWDYNFKKINIYNWKLDFWDKPYFYQFKKTIFFSNVKFFSFEYKTPIEKFTLKYMYLTYLFFIVNLIDYYYTNKYIYILDKDEISNMSLKNWKKKFFTEFDTLEELTHLKNLKLILMAFSSGELIKTPDWNFPYIYEKEYKKKGWTMFEDPKIDAVELDWRPIIKDLN